MDQVSNGKDILCVEKKQMMPMLVGTSTATKGRVFNPTGCSGFKNREYNSEMIGTERALTTYFFMLFLRFKSTFL